MAQAANESGGGTSRFAKEYNALFGQYTYDANDGVIPNKRDEGKKTIEGKRKACWWEDRGTC